MGLKLKRGILIAIDGIDGAGKTTQAAALAEDLREAGFDVVLTKEPTDGQWGRLIRESAQTGRLSPDEELEAFLEDRREHVAALIEPGLRRGRVIICDRYYPSTVAYQGARGLDPHDLRELNESFAPQPDLLVVIDVPPKVGLERVASRGSVADLFETEPELERSRAIFAAEFPSGPGVLQLNGLQPIAVLSARIRAHLLTGPLLDRMCFKGYKDRCEPAFCSFLGSGQCRYPAVGGALLSPLQAALAEAEG